MMNALQVHAVPNQGETQVDNFSVPGWHPPLRRPQELAAIQQANGLPAGEGPFIGGVFDLPALSADELVAYQKAVEAVQTTPRKPAMKGKFIADADGNSNELTVQVDGDNPALLALIPSLAATEAGTVRAEDALVAAIELGDVQTIANFFNPVDVRYAIESERLDSESRTPLKKDDPEEVLMRSVVLRYADIETAKGAQDMLQQQLGRNTVNANRTVKFSFTPNDSYYANNASNPHDSSSNAATYQWGVQAMRFPTAWDTTFGTGYVGIIGSVSWLTKIYHPAESIPPYPAYTETLPAPPADLQANYRAQFSRHIAGGGSEAHDTHTAGIIAATANNNIGVAGACPNCSLAMMQVDMDLEVYIATTDDHIAAAMLALMRRGIQVVNMSFGRQLGCSDLPLTCSAIASANARDMLLVASSGNLTKTGPDYPASDSRVLSVGGAQIVTPSSPTGGWAPWYYGSYGTDTVGTNGPGSNGVVAPAKSIVSTFVPSSNYNPYPYARCSDLSPYDESGTNGDGYASCTGTSMSAPFVAALGGILRSIYPTYSESNIRSLIRSKGDLYPSCTAAKGCGMPNAANAVSDIVSRVPNRLTPLYAFWSSGRQDRFYSIVPQMAGAAFNGTLQPNNACSPAAMVTGAVSTCEGTASTYSAIKYTPEGTGLSDAYSIPGVTTYFSGYPVSNIPLAQVWVFTTPKNPKNAADPLVPLYRLSWKCGDATSTPPAVCTTSPQHMDTTYSADSAGVSAFVSWGYALDGIEGYIYPKTSPQPPGTVKPMRKYNPTRDDHAIFPDTLLSTMTAQGYTDDSGSDWLGYVYPNGGSGVPAIL